MARVYVDTSAFYSVIVENDAAHASARRIFDDLRREDAELLTSNYVVHETVSLLQRRWGIEAVRDWQRLAEPALETVWVDAEVHRRALIALLAAADRRISLTDWASFEVMREEDIRRAFAFDEDFHGRGFEVIP